MIEDLNEMVSIQRDLAEAESALADHDAGVTRARLVARLAADNPVHPVLWGARTTLLLAGVLVVGALGWTLAVAFAVPVPEELMTVLESNSAFPGPMILAALALCGLMSSAALRELAAEMGANRPLLPDESKERQRLVSEVTRLRTKLRIDSERPAPMRQWASA